MKNKNNNYQKNTRMQTKIKEERKMNTRIKRIKMKIRTKVQRETETKRKVEKLLNCKSGEN